ncbi:MAG TPA: hypothetical protein VHS31_08995 [Tepidisphaeraceae bacterium]|jgi:hypothetical protein|nr:hypothetical protein [Tepidisphaeraceae bacterium]
MNNSIFHNKPLNVRYWFGLAGQAFLSATSSFVLKRYQKSPRNGHSNANTARFSQGSAIHPFPNRYPLHRKNSCADVLDKIIVAIYAATGSDNNRQIATNNPLPIFAADISGATTHISDHAARISGSDIDMSGNAPHISGQDIYISGAVTRISDDGTHINDYATYITGDVAHISGHAVYMSGHAARTGNAFSRPGSHSTRARHPESRSCACVGSTTQKMDRQELESCLIIYPSYDCEYKGAT